MFQEKRPSRQGKQAFCKDTREQTQGSTASQSLVTYRLCETPRHLGSKSKAICANDRWHNNSMVTLKFKCIQCESHKSIQTTITPNILCHINHRQKSWKLQGSGDGKKVKKEEKVPVPGTLHRNLLQGRKVLRERLWPLQIYQLGTQESAPTARDYTSAQAQAQQSIISFSSGSSSSVLLPFIITVLHLVFARLRIQMCISVNTGPWYTLNICFFPHLYFFRGTFRTGSATCTNMCCWPQECSQKCCITVGWCKRKKRCTGMSKRVLSLKGKKPLKQIRKKVRFPL